MSQNRRLLHSKKTSLEEKSGQLNVAELDRWLISDFIHKKSEKFEFRKNFVTIFSVAKTDQRKRNFDFFAHAINEKLQN